MSSVASRVEKLFRGLSQSRPEWQLFTGGGGSIGSVSSCRWYFLLNLKRYSVCHFFPSDLTLDNVRPLTKM